MMPATTWIQRNSASRTCVISITRLLPRGPALGLAPAYQARWRVVNRATCGSRRERYARRGRPLCAHVDLRLTRAEPLVPHPDDVIAGRDVPQRHPAVRPAHAEVRVIDHSEPSLHPGMQVAADADHHLGMVDRDRPLGALARERDVPAARLLGRAVDVVQQGVAVAELDRLADLRAGDARHVETSLLIDHDGLLRDRERAIPEPVLDVDERVLELAVLHQHVAGGHGPLMLARALREAAHGELLHGGRGRAAAPR